MINVGRPASLGCSCGSGRELMGLGLGADATTTTTTPVTYTQAEVDAIVHDTMDLVGTGQLIPGVSNTMLILGGIGAILAVALFKRS